MVWEASSSVRGVCGFRIRRVGGKKSSLSLGWSRWAHDLHARRMVWLWTSYSRTLMPAGSLGPASVGIASRETRLFSHTREPSKRKVPAGRRRWVSSSSLPPPLPLCALLGIPGAAVSLELCSSGDTLMRCTMHPVPIQPDADRSSVCECVLSWPPMETIVNVARCGPSTASLCPGHARQSRHSRGRSLAILASLRWAR